MTGFRRVDCGQARQLLALVPGGDLLPADDSAVRRHLAECPNCQRDLGGFLQARRALRSISPESSPEFDVDFFADLKDDILSEVRLHRPRRNRSRSRVGSALMSAAALFLLGVYLLPQGSSVQDLPSIDPSAPRPSTSLGYPYRDLGNSISDRFGMNGRKPDLKAIVKVRYDGMAKHPDGSITGETGDVDKTGRLQQDRRKRRRGKDGGAVSNGPDTGR